MRMATFRAIENGFSPVRPISNGFSITTDYYGRVSTYTDYFTSENPVMVAYVPTKGRSTIYSQVGDVFGWLCVAGLVARLDLALFDKLIFTIPLLLC